MSPREFQCELAAATLRLQDESDRDLALAWHGELFSRQKKLESLGVLLKRKRIAAAGDKGSPNHMLAIVEQLAKQYGGKIERHKGES